MKKLHTVFNLLLFPFTFFSKSQLKHFVIIFLPLIVTNVQIQAACTDYNGDRKTCQADTSCVWSPSTKICSDVPSSNNNPQITSGNTFSILEESGTAVGTVTASDADSDPLTFSITGGADNGSFAITSGGALSFNAEPDYENPTDTGTNNSYEVIVTVSDDNGGTNSQTITVTVTNDTSDDNTNPKITSGNTFSLQENSGIAVGTVTATDADSDPLTFSITGGADNGSFTITSGGALSFNSVPDYENPTDTGSNNTYEVTITVSDNNGGTDSQTISVTVTNDTSDDPTTPSASITDASIAEGDSGTSTLDFTVTLSAAAPTGGVTLDYATSDGTATTADSDYVSANGTLTIAAGATTGTVSVTINGDTTVEPNETFTVTLSNPTNATLGTASATGTITNDDTASTPSASIADASIAEGDSGTSTLDFTVTLSAAAPTGGVTLDYATSDGTATTADSDYVSANGTLTIAAGATTGTVSVTINGDTTVEPNETFTVTLSNPTNATLGTASAVGTITNNDSSSTVSSIVDLCYIDSIGNGNKCDTIDGFYYGPNNPHTCLAEVTIENNGSSTITSVEIIKAYDANVDTIVSDDCGIDGSSGDCSLNSSLSGYGSYGGGIVYTLGNMDANTTHILYDEDTYSSGTVSGITLFGSYAIGGTTYSGEIYSCSSGMDSNISQFTASVDIIDDSNSYTYANSTYNSWIQTKVSQQGGYTFTAVYLGKYGESIAPQPYYPTGGNQASSLTMLYKLADMSNNATCETAPFVDLFETVGGSTPVVSIIDAGETFGVSNSFVMAYKDGDNVYSKKNLRLKYKAVDFNQLFDDAGIQCVQRSSTGGVVEGIPACLITNSPNNSTPGENYKKVFGENAFNRCYTENGKPCYASNGGIGAYPYDTEYGCFECSLGDFPYVCSNDNFAIRPNKFDEEMISHTDAPHLLRAGEAYPVSLTARDATNDISYGYTVNTYNFHNDLETNTTKYFRDSTKDTIGLLHGNSDINDSLVGYMVNGLTSIASAGPLLSGVADETLTVSYDDIGKIGLFIYDKNWAEVDNDDTPMDCISPVHTYICGESNVTFIPHHFKVDNIHLRNHGDGNFTYLSNDLNMSAPIDVMISAMNANNTITQNFRQGSLYYENPISVDLNVTEWDTSTPSTRHPKGNAVHKHDIPIETLLGFGGADANGTHLIPWDESNTTQQLLFNYTRQNNQTVNPFEIGGTDINITVQSTYTDVSSPSSPAVIVGSGIGDQSATFYFGRAKSSLFFYENIEASSVLTPISILIYCDTYPVCSELEANEIEIESKWWLSANHNEGDNDGNITLVMGDKTPSSGTATVNTNVNIPNGGIDGTDNTITVTRTSADTLLPLLVEIDLDTSSPTTTNTWLIYNPDSDILDPDPFYKVLFIGGQSSWTGVGETGHVVDIDASRKKSKRMDW